MFDSVGAALEVLRSKKEKLRERGFSLIELIIVIVVIGVLTAIAIPVFGNVQDDSRQESVQMAATNAVNPLQEEIMLSDRGSGVDRVLADMNTASVDGDEEGIYISLANDDGLNNQDDLCVRAEWIGDSENYAVAGPGCEDVEPGPSDEESCENDAQTTKDGIEYLLSTSCNTATAVEYDGDNSELEIPSEINHSGESYELTEIGEEAFQENGLTKVGIPNTIESIGNEAFENNDLTEVVIPNSVKTIGNWSFRYNDLNSLTISDSATEIGAGAFAYNELESVDIPNSVVNIMNSAFWDNRLTDVKIPDSVTFIDEYAFRDNELENVYFDGAAPRVSRPGTIKEFGDTGSFGEYNSELTLHYHSEYASENNDEEEGFTSPTWMGYNTESID